MANVTQSGMRKITTGAGTRTNYELYHGVTCSFPVTSDTGPVEGAKVTGARVYVSALKSFSEYYYLELSFGGGALAKTSNPGKNEDTHSETFTLKSLSSGLLTDEASSIVFGVVTTNSVTGPKLLFRDGCTLTLEIDYAPDTGSGEGGDGGGGESGGGSENAFDCVAAQNLKLSSNVSYGEKVTLTWKYPANEGGLISMYLHTEYSEDGTTWEQVATSIDLRGTGGLESTYSMEVSPPSVLWAYYRFRVRTYGTANGSYVTHYSEYSDTLQYIRPVLVPYTDDPLIAGETRVKAAHMLELQTNINMIRQAEGLAAHPFTAIEAGRTNLAAWSTHVSELRFAIDEMGIEHEAWILFDVNAPRADVITQLRRVVGAL